MIAAQQYYIDYGPDMSVDRLNSLMPSYIPDSSLQGMKALNFWLQGEQYCGYAEQCLYQLLIIVHLLLALPTHIVCV